MYRRVWVFLSEKRISEAVYKSVNRNLFLTERAVAGLVGFVLRYIRCVEGGGNLDALDLVYGTEDRACAAYGPMYKNIR